MVILHVTSFWGVTWSLRDLLSLTIWQTLGVGVLLAGAYYLAASAVFPEHPEQFENFDDYYWAHKREVLGIILACSLALQIIALVLGRPLSPLTIAINLPVFVTLAIACFSRSRALDLAMIGSLIAIMTVNLALP
jgi:hypothetical protein